MAAGRCNLPAVAVYWLMESCEAWYGKMGGGGVLAGQAGKNGIGWLEVEICSVKRMTADERLFPADAGSELAGCCGMFGVTVLPAGLAEKQNVVLQCSPGCKPGGGACGARSPAYSRCVLLSAAYSFVFSPSLQKSAKKSLYFLFFAYYMYRTAWRYAGLRPA